LFETLVSNYSVSPREKDTSRVSLAIEADTRSRILDAAEALFMAHGLEATTVPRTR
jgi:AcrR family transcriptional regulator